MGTQSKKETVTCDGGAYNGHPLVYLDIAKKGSVKCPYCSRDFTHDFDEKNET